jgi:hypothetical protein
MRIQKLKEEIRRLENFECEARLHKEKLVKMEMQEKEKREEESAKKAEDML